MTLGQKHAIGAMAGMSYTYSDSRSVGASLTVLYTIRRPAAMSNNHQPSASNQ